MYATKKSINQEGGFHKKAANEPSLQVVNDWLELKVFAPCQLNFLFYAAHS